MPTAASLYIGLMSGTSMDGIDAALVEFGDHSQRLIGFQTTPWSTEMVTHLRTLAHPGDNEIDRLGPLDIAVADTFSTAVEQLLQDTGTAREAVAAIGSHGQTIRHRPSSRPPFTLQIGDPSRLAENTGITVVADFRRRDMAAGGQGAPLVPAYHANWFHDRNEGRVVLNIGGIANITLLPRSPDQPVTGFDTGPGNTLLDRWIQLKKGVGYDAGGQWSASGNVHPPLLEALLSDPYFEQPPPKSTGPEYFNLDWLMQYLQPLDITAADTQATLAALTARSISNSIRGSGTDCTRLIVCGGGVHNLELMRLLQDMLPDMAVTSSSAFGVGPDQVEATAFAWLARQTLLGLPGNLPSATGARRPVILGGIYQAT